MIALLLGRFHALTRAQAELVASFAQEVAISRIVCVVTSADHAGTRRNPLPVEQREELLRPALAAAGKPFDVVRVADIPDDAGWVAHVRAVVQAAAAIDLAPASTLLVSVNRDVRALFTAAGYPLAGPSSPEPDPENDAISTGTGGTGGTGDTGGAGDADGTGGTGDTGGTGGAGGTGGTGAVAVSASRGAVAALVAHAPVALTPHELIARVVAGQPWQADAAPSMIAVYERHAVPAALARIFADRLRTDDGELGAHRDFATYGAQMDASLVQKLEDLLPWVKPPCIVDKGCGTGKLLVELSRRFPGARLVGVDLSRELLRRSDENTYAGGDVELLAGDAAEQQLPDGSADTIVFSSIMHEVYSYSSYDHDRVRRAVAAAARELRPGGRILVRDGISPGPRPVELALLDEPTIARFERFAREFKHGQGAAHVRLDRAHVRISAHLANEFLCKKDYAANWDIEVHEEYGAFTVDEWRAVMGGAGLRVLELRAYVNEWIRQNRYQDHVRVTEPDGSTFWPATNAVIVAEKP